MRKLLSILVVLSVVIIAGTAVQRGCLVAEEPGRPFAEIRDAILRRDEEIHRLRSREMIDPLTRFKHHARVRAEELTFEDGRIVEALVYWGNDVTGRCAWHVPGNPPDGFVKILGASDAGRIGWYEPSRDRQFLVYCTADDELWWETIGRFLDFQGFSEPNDLSAVDTWFSSADKDLNIEYGHGNDTLNFAVTTELNADADITPQGKRCPECLKSGKRSKVYVAGQSVTAAGIIEYYDEDGEYHYEDPNTCRTDYRCSEGHEFTDGE